MRTLEELADWHAVHDLSLRYAEAVDQRNWPALRAVFTERVAVDFSSVTHSPPTGEVAASEWVASVRATIDGFTATQHLIGNHRIVLDGDRGRYGAYVQAQHWMATDRWYLVGGRYENVVRRDGGEWRISAITVHQQWDAGDRSLFREAARLVAERSGARPA
jgi:3-phenylpropionate/cinnamic acid dioxygenase small subunit